MNRYCNGLFAVVKSLLKFERALFNCYRLASKTYTEHTEFWASLAFAKLARIRIYRSIFACMKEHPRKFRIDRPVTGTFVHLYFKLCSTANQLKLLRLTEDQFLEISISVETIMDQHGLSPAIHCNSVDAARVFSTVENIQRRQIRLLEGFLYLTAEII